MGDTKTSFQFGTKAQTLQRLHPLVKSATILNQVSFTVSDWKKNKDAVVNIIQKEFTSGKIVVRSSSLDEDSNIASMAGKYESILNVDATSKSAISDAITRVINSYGTKGSTNDANQVLVQAQLEKITMSGVMFTKDIDTHAPYIIINYDDQTGSTSSVTSGSGTGLKIFTFYKHETTLPSSPLLRELIALATELEKITNNNGLDVEFARTSDKLYLLQVRPITSVVQLPADFQTTFAGTLKQIKKFITQNNVPYPNLFGYRTVYGIMPDWNPAEIIGISPKPLAYSLYRHIITDIVWPLGRKKVGYRDVGHQPGMISLGGKPYIDVRMSINTFMQNDLSPILCEKLANYYIDKLIMHPELHDKIEFDIVFTSFSFDFDEKEKELLTQNFSNLQIKEIKESLIKFTDAIIGERITTVAAEMALCEEMNKRREKIIKSDVDYDVKISQLLHDCSELGTLPFVKLARFAFVSNILLKSLVKKGILSQDEYSQFFGSVKTVAAEFVENLVLLKDKKITRGDFVRKFGHLRPGTYDICSNSYSDSFDDYIDLKNFTGSVHTTTEFDLPEQTRAKIAAEIKKVGFTFSVEQFLTFARASIKAREECKFEFTKNLDLVLQYCGQYLQQYGLSKEDISFLEIEDVIRFAYMSDPVYKEAFFREIIERNKQLYVITKAIRLPPLVYMEKNVDYFHLMDDKPNYITNKTVVGEVLYVTAQGIQGDELKDKIVLIDSADPGYDWIFSHKIKGLITLYGGVASHMSIRAAEFGLPAAIGCGGAIFNLVKSSQKIELNCAANKIRKIL